jgi:hypothetical protein
LGIIRRGWKNWKNLDEFKSLPPKEAKDLRIAGAKMAQWERNAFSMEYSVERLRLQLELEEARVKAYFIWTTDMAADEIKEKVLQLARLEAEAKAKSKYARMNISTSTMYWLGCGKVPPKLNKIYDAKGTTIRKYRVMGKKYQLAEKKARSIRQRWENGWVMQQLSTTVAPVVDGGSDDILPFPFFSHRARVEQVLYILNILKAEAAKAEAEVARAKAEVNNEQELNQRDRLNLVKKAGNDEKAAIEKEEGQTAATSGHSPSSS